MPEADSSRSTLGVPGLDEILGGGLVPGRVYLVDGDPGSGKTTLALQFLLEGRRIGERGVYVTLSETRDELLAGAASHGWSLDGIDVVELNAGDRDLGGEDDLAMYQPAEVELTETTRRVLSIVEELSPQRLVFDSLSELRLLAQSSLRYRRQILALKRFFVGRGCTVLLLDDRTSEGPDLQLHSIAHGVVSLEHRAPAYGAAQRRLKVVKLRGSGFMTGLHDFSLDRGGLTVFPRLVGSRFDASFRPERVPSGVAALDALLGGGIDRGTSTLVSGPPGSGKSTIALQYATAAAARGDHAAIFAFEETATILHARASGLGMRIVPGTGPGQIDVHQVDPAEVMPGEFAWSVRQAVERDGARVVVIDSLNGYLNAMPEDRYLTVQLHELLAYLNNHGVATFLVVAQAGVLGMSARSPVDASYLADSVVMLRMYEHEGRVHRAISVLKKRSGPHEATIRRLELDARGVHLSEPLSNLRGVISGVPVAVGREPDGRPGGFPGSDGH
jgi:circadian clock protein KaiC